MYILKMKIQIFFEQEANTVSFSIKAQTLLTYLILYTNAKNLTTLTFKNKYHVHVNWSLL